MKSKLFLTVLLLAVITTIGITRWYKHWLYSMTPTAVVERLVMGEESLVGLKDVYVFTWPFWEDPNSAGLTKEQLEQVRTDVESKLRLAGIKVNSPAEWLSSKHEEQFLVTIDAVSDDDSPRIAYIVDVELSQLSKLLRRPYATVFGPTWSTGTVGMCLKNEFPERARQAVKDNVDEFIRIYLKANPKK